MACQLRAGNCGGVSSAVMPGIMAHLTCACSCIAQICSVITAVQPREAHHSCHARSLRVQVRLQGLCAMAQYRHSPHLNDQGASQGGKSHQSCHAQAADFECHIAGAVKPREPAASRVYRVCLQLRCSLATEKSCTSTIRVRSREVGNTRAVMPRLPTLKATSQALSSSGGLRLAALARYVYGASQLMRAAPQRPECDPGRLEPRGLSCPGCRL